MRSIILLGLAVTLASTACSDETGILVHTTANAEITEPIHKLQYFVGADTGGDAMLFVDEAPSERVLVDDRDLREDSYRLMIRPKTDAPDDAVYAIGVIAFSEAGDQVGFGYLAEPVAFVKGSVTQWDIEIHGFTGDDYDYFPDDCIRWMDGDNPMGIGNINDQDCDGYPAGDSPETDCNDNDPAIHPGITEQCNNGVDDNCDGAMDGLQADGVTPVAETADGKDNDCDGHCDDDPELDIDRDGFTEFGRFGVCSTSMDAYDCDDGELSFGPGAWESCDMRDSNCDGDKEEPVPCFIGVEDGAVGDRCLQGERECPSEGASANKLCVPLSLDPATQSFPPGCQAIAPCTALDDATRIDCLLERLGPQDTPDHTCRTFHSATTGTCGGKGEVRLPPPDALGLAGACTFQLFGPSQQQGYILTLEASDGSGGASTLINDCAVKLHIEVTDASGFADVIILFTRRNGTEPYTDTMSLHLKNELTAECADDQAIQCPNWPDPAGN